MHIQTHEEYKAAFEVSGDPHPNAQADAALTPSAHRALQCALDVRKFEIELYWKRAAYFWTLNAAALAGYALILTKAGRDPQPLAFTVSCVGVVVSTGWYLVNRGSKYWQENWERHVDCLEDGAMGPLYKTTIAEERFPFWSLGGYPYSVSKVNQLVSMFVSLLWVVLAISAFPLSALVFPLTVAFLTILSVVALFKYARGGSRGRARVVDFHRSDLVDATSAASGGLRRGVKGTAASQEHGGGGGGKGSGA